MCLCWRFALKVQRLVLMVLKVFANSARSCAKGARGCALCDGDSEWCAMYAMGAEVMFCMLSCVLLGTMLYVPEAVEGELE